MILPEHYEEGRGPYSEIANLKAEIERLQDWKRRQMEDIMTLGLEVGKLERQRDKLRRVMKEFADTRNPAIPLWISLKASKVLANAESYEQAMAREHGPDLIRER